MHTANAFKQAAALACFLAAFSVGSAAATQLRAIGIGAPLRHECRSPSIDRLQQWLASGEGATVPTTGSLLVRDGERYVAKIEFLKPEWHVAVVWLGNRFEDKTDLSESRGFWLTYSAINEFYVQLRPASHWSGGNKWVTFVPATGGKSVRRFFSFSPAKWTWLPELGKPSHSFASALREARGLVFVGKTSNMLVVEGLRISGYVPRCL